MQRGTFLLIMLALFFMLFIGSLVIIIYNSVTPYTPTDYQIIYIEEMPCLVIDSGYGKGITCDWSEWKGE